MRASEYVMSAAGILCILCAFVFPGNNVVLFAMGLGVFLVAQGIGSRADNQAIKYGRKR